MEIICSHLWRIYIQRGLIREGKTNKALRDVAGRRIWIINTSSDSFSSVTLMLVAKQQWAMTNDRGGDNSRHNNQRCMRTIRLQENAFLLQTIRSYFFTDDQKGTAANIMQKSDWIRAVKLENRRSLMSHLWAAASLSDWQTGVALAAIWSVP